MECITFEKENKKTKKTKKQKKNKKKPSRLKTRNGGLGKS